MIEERRHEPEFIKCPECSSELNTDHVVLQGGDSGFHIYCSNSDCEFESRT